MCVPLSASGRPIVVPRTTRLFRVPAQPSIDCHDMSWPPIYLCSFNQTCQPTCHCDYRFLGVLLLRTEGELVPLDWLGPAYTPPPPLEV